MGDEKFSFKDLKMPTIPKIPSWAIVTALLLLAVFFTTQARWASVDLPMTKDWAENSVENNVRNSVIQEMNSQFPNLPTDVKQAEIDKRTSQVLEEQKSTIEKTVVEMTAYFKSRLQDPWGHTYLLEIDTFHHLRRIENLLTKGIVCDEIRGGMCIDNHKYAPLGELVEYELHHYVSYYFIKAVQLFNQSLHPMWIFFFMPVVLACLAVIPVFFVVKKRAGIFGGFVAAFLTGMSAFFVERTTAGFADTDGYVVLFIGVITWCFLEAADAEGLKKKLLYLGITAISTGLFAFAWWNGWWFILYAGMGALGGNLAYVFIRQQFFLKEKAIWKNKQFLSAVALTAFFVIAVVFIIGLIFGPASLDSLYRAPLTRLKITSSATNAEGSWTGSGNLWPNVYTTVAELHRTSLQNVISGIGPGVIVAIGLASLVLLFYRKDDRLESKDYWLIGGSFAYYAFLVFAKALQTNIFLFGIYLSIPVIVTAWMKVKEVENVTTPLLFLVFFAGFTLASINGVRFLLFFAPIYGIMGGISFGRILSFSKEFATKDVFIKLISVTIIICLCLLLIKPYSAAMGSYGQRIPNINDAWVDSLTAIKDNSDQNAIITSWWDFGHWFKYYADRGVTFDGASQNNAMAYIVGRALVTDNEDEAVGLLRQLDCSNFKAYEYFTKAVNDDAVLADDVLVAIAAMNKEEAKSYLENKGLPTTDQDMLTDERIRHLNYGDDLLQLTHCDPPEGFFITSQDMVGKAPVWSHFGLWSFRRAFVYNNKDNPNIIPKTMELFNMTSEEASRFVFETQSLTGVEEINSWISPWPGFVGAGSCESDNETTTCNFNINMGNAIITKALITNETQQLYVAVQGPNGQISEQTVAPQAFLVNGKEYPGIEGSMIPYVVAVDNGNAVIGSPEVVNSIFTRLFFFDADGLTHFEKFYEARSVIGDKIIVWKVKW